MDNLTHTLTGLMLSRAGFNRLTPRASILMMLAANAPDFDVVMSALGSGSYLDWHRGPTHGFATLPITAAILAVLFGLPRRPANYSWIGAWLAALVALLSHVLLDWTNIYGIRFLSPFSDAWFRLDATPVVDPWIWMILLAGVAWPALSKLVSSEIGARSSPGPGMARFVLIALLAYDFGRWTLHGRAIETLNAHLFEQRVPKRVFAFPDFANPFEWRGLIDLGDAWQVTSLNLLKPFDPGQGRVYYNAPPSPAITAARTTRSFQSLQRFSQSLHWRELPVPVPEGAIEVVATDMRFANPGEGGFTARAVILPNGQIEESRFQFSTGGKPPRPR